MYALHPHDNNKLNNSADLNPLSQEILMKAHNSLLLLLVINVQASCEYLCTYKLAS